MNGFKTKLLSVLLVMALLITMIPINVFASEGKGSISCEEVGHDFTVKKYDESNHWNECSVCGVADELLNHYYDESGDTTCNGCLYERSIVENFSIDKTLMSEGETATITVKVIDGYTAKCIYLYKPITNITETIYLYLDSDNTYTGTFCVDDQTESGIWKAKYISLRNSNDEYVYLYNSDSYTGTNYKKMDLSSLNFEVTGTEADVEAPVIESYSVDKSVVSAGEKVTFTVQVTDDHLPSSFWFWFKSPSGESEYVSMKKIDDTGVYQGAFSVDENFEIGVWKPYYFTVSDTNDNSITIYNNKVASYGTNKEDLSSLNFEVVEVNEENEEADSFIVTFKDGFGTTLSTQRVAKGEEATAPTDPTNDIYLFDGWDKDFSNVTSNLTVTAKWIDNPNATYDKEVHLGNTFKISVGASVDQTYTITCNKDIDYTFEHTGNTYTNLGGSYYGKTYTVTVNESGSYYFYVKGSVSTNTLSYKVKVTGHNYSDKWTVDKEATCTEDGSKYRKCTVCDATTDVTTIEKLGHDYSDEWTVDKEATCTEDGSKSRHCSRCNATTDEIIIDALSPTGHQYSDEWTIDKEATCTEVGSKSHHCTICGEKIDIIEIEALGHIWGEANIEKEPTYETEGLQVYKCKGCGITKEECIPVLERIEISSVILSETEFIYNGKRQIPTVVVKAGNTVLTENIDYNVQYGVGDDNMTDYGQYALVVTGTGKYTGHIVEYFWIVHKTLPNAELTTYNYIYNGKVLKPKVVIKDGSYKLVENKDYYVEYDAIGGYRDPYRYSIQVYGMDAYEGYQELHYNILPKAPSKVTSTLYGYDDVKVTWSESRGAHGYVVYYKKSTESKYKKLGTTKKLYYKVTNLADGAKYTFKVVPYLYGYGKNYESTQSKTASLYTLKKIENVKVVKSGSKVKVSWTNISGETGYQISKSTKKSGTNVVSTYKTTSGKYKKISATKKKTYYYKVRAYKVVGGKKIYGPWSTAVKFVRK